MLRWLLRLGCILTVASWPPAQPLLVEDSDVSALPLIEIPASGLGENEADQHLLAVILSGDGGWNKMFVGSVAKRLAKHGIAVVGWNSLRYFWKKKTPEQMSADLAQVIRHYTRDWHRERVLLIGYSFGADVIPFMANRLPPDLRSKLELVAMMGPDGNIDFEIHMFDWLADYIHADSVEVVPEIAKLDWTRRLCIYGSQEKHSACPELAGTGVTLQKMPGRHHFGKNYTNLVARLLGYLHA